MILVDANVLLFAVNRDAPEHERSKRWLDRQLSGATRVGLPWQSLLAFVRIASNPSAFRHPVSAVAAWGQVRIWLGTGVAWIPVPGDRHADVLGELFGSIEMSSRLVSDAQ